MSLRIRALLTFAILAVIAACGQAQQPKAAPPSNQVQQPAATQPKADDRPLAKVPAAQRANTWKSAPPMTIDVKKNTVATLTTSKGIIVVALDASAAPQTVNNFVFLVNQGFYDGLTFHRVVAGFVIQGGDPLGTGTGGPGYTVPAEIKLPHVEGAIAMARLGDQQNPQRASSGSQFYITLAPTPNLDGAYTAFGQVTSGMDVVKKIQIGDVIQKIVISGQ
jgi:cyclophilin family peptidyl-prolyl cis-trans isomerase/predicted small lipoprotein YifL